MVALIIILTAGLLAVGLAGHIFFFVIIPIITDRIK